MTIYTPGTPVKSLSGTAAEFIKTVQILEEGQSVDVAQVRRVDDGEILNVPFSKITVAAPVLTPEDKSWIDAYMLCKDADTINGLLREAFPHNAKKRLAWEYLTPAQKRFLKPDSEKTANELEIDNVSIDGWTYLDKIDTLVHILSRRNGMYTIQHPGGKCETVKASALAHPHSEKAGGAERWGV